MKKEKFTGDSQEIMKKASTDEVLTLIFRTKVKVLADKEIKMAVEMLQEKQMATSRTQLLKRVHERYGKGADFCKNYKDSRLKEQGKLVNAAPKAVNLWLADAVAVSGTKKELEDLATHEDVESVDVNPTFRIPEILQTPLEDTPELIDGSTWGVAKIQAPEVWGGFGRGEKVLVGHLDTGVDDTHPALAGKVQRFFQVDALGNSTIVAPFDSHFHGTHTAGTICGRTFRGVNIGVAPEAKLCSALVLPGGGGTFAQVIGGMQAVLNEGVHIINMSLGANGYFPIFNIPILIGSFQALIVCSIGNSGHGTSGGPGNDPFAFGVGATHYKDVVAGFSGGETLVGVPWLGIFSLTYMKPDLSAPGVQVISAVPGPDLAALNGTSMAAPHVAGAAALLHSAAPSLQNDFLQSRTRSILAGAGREDYGEAGLDQRFGFGRLDALSATEAAVSVTS